VRVLVSHENDVSSLWRPFINPDSHEGEKKQLADEFGFGGLEAVALDELGYDAYGGRGDGRISCFDLGSNKVWFEAEGVSKVTSLVVDGRTMKAMRGAQNGILDVWDLNTGDRGKQLVGHADNVVAINMDAAGNRAVTGSHDYNIIFWDLQKAMESGRITGGGAGREGAVLALATNWEKGLMLSGSQDEKLKLWNINDRSLIGTMEGHSEAVRFVSADWEQMRAVSVSSEGTVKLWDLTTFECTLTFPDDQRAGEVLAFNVHWPSMQAMAVLQDGRAQIWDLKDPTNNPLSESRYGGSIKIATIAPGQEGEVGKPRRNRGEQLPNGT